MADPDVSKTTTSTAINDNLSDDEITGPVVSVADISAALGLDEDMFLRRLAGILAKREPDAQS